MELELRNFTRELPLANLDFGALATVSGRFARRREGRSAGRGLVHDFKVAIQTPEASPADQHGPSGAFGVSLRGLVGLERGGAVRGMAWQWLARVPSNGVGFSVEAPPPQPPGKLAALLPRVLDVSSAPRLCMTNALDGCHGSGHWMPAFSDR